MRAKTWLWLGLILGLEAALAALSSRLPGLGANLRWDLTSMLHPPGAGARPLQ